MEQQEEIGILDVEATSTKQDILNFRTICLEHYRRILNLGSREMRGGHYEERVKTTQHGSYIEKTYVEDTRESYISAIDNLAIALSPHFDKQMEQERLEIKNKIKLLKEKYYAGNEWKDKQTKDIYRAERLKVKQELFEHLSSFMKRKRYFDASHLES